MREIKFRAYYQKATTGGWIILGEYTLKDLTSRGITFDQDRVKWVLYTDLKDKNGREIYEGDIIKFMADDIEGTKTEYTEVVEWDRDNGCYPLWSRDDSALTSMKWRYIYADEFRETVEVIGNRFKHPGLLTPPEGREG